MNFTANPFLSSPASPIRMREIPCEIGTEIWGVSSVCEMCRYELCGSHCRGCKTPRLAYLGSVENILYTRSGFELQTRSPSGPRRVMGADLGTWAYTGREDAARALRHLTGRSA